MHTKGNWKVFETFSYIIGGTVLFVYLILVGSGTLDNKDRVKKPMTEYNPVAVAEENSMFYINFIMSDSISNILTAGVYKPSNLSERNILLQAMIAERNNLKVLQDRATDRLDQTIEKVIKLAAITEVHLIDGDRKDEVENAYKILQQDIKELKEDISNETIS
ncbi:MULTISPECIES: hypothetical protein [unclassified Psychrobacillus]|uniref:hypothetical protein n=1 Tax=unclassified Psychrobacillus TaxID=2636677 RepID=UPI0030F633C6